MFAQFGQMSDVLATVPNNGLGLHGMRTLEQDLFGFGPVGGRPLISTLTLFICSTFCARSLFDAHAGTSSHVAAGMVCHGVWQNE